MYTFFCRADLGDSVGLAKSPASHESSISSGKAAVVVRLAAQKPDKCKKVHHVTQWLTRI